MQVRHHRQREKTICGIAVTIMTALLLFVSVMPVVADEKVHAENQQAASTEMICEIRNTLWCDSLVETNSGDLAADAFRFAASNFRNENERFSEYAGVPVIAAVSGNAIQNNLPNGTLTNADLTAAFPNSGTVMLAEITPATLYDVLENAVSGIEGQDADTGRLTGDPDNSRFLQISGIRFLYDPAAPAGEKIQVVSLEEGNGTDFLKKDNEEEMSPGSAADGENPAPYADTDALRTGGVLLDRTDHETKLIFVTDSHMMAGEDGYDMLTALPVLGELGDAPGIVEEYIRQITDDGSELLNIPTNGRRIIPMQEESLAAEDSAEANGDLETYEAAIRIDKEGKPAKNEKILYYVDGLEAGRTETDSNGFLRIEVVEGPHSVSLSEEQQQIYINNYTGAGTADDVPTLQYQQPPEPVQPRDDSYLSLILQIIVILAAVCLFMTRRKLNHKNRGSSQ